MKGILFLCLLVGGCAAMELTSEYQGSRRETTVVGEKSFQVWRHPTDPSRILVEDNFGAAMGKGFVGALTLGTADTNGAARTYEAAALKYLREHGKQCDVVRSTLVPDAGYEITVKCEEAKS